MARRASLPLLPLLAAAALLAAPSGAGEPAPAITVAPEPVPIRRTVEAELRGVERPAARARIAGLLRDLRVREGDRVTKGEVVARIVDPELDPRIAAAEARAAAAEAARAEAEADLSRQQDLFADGTIPAARLEDAERRATDRRAAARAARRQVETLDARRARGRVLAPADGRVLEIRPTEGAALRPGAVVARVAAHPLRLRIALPEAHLDALRAGGAVRLGAGGGRPAELVRVLPDVAAGRVEAELALPEGVAPGPVGRSLPVRLTVGSVSRIVVPLSHVTEAGGLAFVERAGAGRTLVRLGRRLGDRVVVLSGLREGDRLVAP